MKDKNDDLNGTRLSLREAAEEQLKNAEAGSAPPCPDEASRLQQEVRVYHVELEMQNEELRRIQLELEHSRRRYKDLYHHAPEGYIVLDFAGIIVEANATFVGMVGREDVRGTAVAEYLIPEDQPIFRARLRSFLKRPADKKIEVRIGCGELSPRHVVLASALRQSDAAGEHHVLEEVFVTVTDVSELARVREELQRSRQFTLSILDSLTSHVCVINSHGEIISVNQAWRRFAEANPPVHGRAAEKTNYFSVCEVAQGKDASSAAAFASGIRAVLDGRKDHFSMEYPCHSPQEKRWFVGSVTRLSGPFSGHAVIAHENITERKLVEQERLDLHEQVSKLAKAESLSRMAGSVAHSFNNTLSVVVGNLEMALDELKNGENAVERIRGALKGAWQAAQTSGMMLTYLGFGLNNSSGLNEGIDLGTACRDIVAGLLPKRPAGLEIVSDFPSPGPFVRIDRDHVRQVLANLMENAWEAIGDGRGRIELSIDIVESVVIELNRHFPVDWQPKTGRYAQLTVSDNGCGIEEDILDNLFDPFFTTRFAGRGMGLPVVLGILRAYDGGVTITSRPGSGSSVRVFLPLVEEEIASARDNTTTC